jgi:hypothetical protein
MSRESLRRLVKELKVADEYHVSHETVGRVILDATKGPVQHESQLYNLS